MYIMADYFTTFDALTTARPYREPFTVEDAMKIIKNDSAIQFDPEVVLALKNSAL